MRGGKYSYFGSMETTKKYKILFVCLGNICRSPMAEFIMKDEVRRQNREGEFWIASAGTSGEIPCRTVLSARV